MDDAGLGGWLGAGYAFLAACCFATGNIAIVKAKGEVGDKGATLSVVITAVVAATIWLTAEGGELPATGDPRLLEALLWFGLAGLFVMALGRALVFQSIQRLGATRASAVKRVNPFFSVALAWALLGESVSRADALGMGLIGLAFAIMVRRSMKAVEGAEDAPPPAADYAWGVAASACYASSYIARKFGLAAVALPAFGTMISALVGLAAVGLLSLVLVRFRDNLLNMFRRATPWTVGAGCAISFGQIFTFAALAHAEVMTVVMVASLEIFISNVLAVAVFRTETRAHPSTVIAAALAATGAVAVSAQ